jgi:hypothetical protein
LHSQLLLWPRLQVRLLALLLCRHVPFLLLVALLCWLLPLR